MTTAEQQELLKMLHVAGFEVILRPEILAKFEKLNELIREDQILKDADICKTQTHIHGFGAEDMRAELRTVEEFRNAEPGTYVVTGEASAEMARQVARQLERKSFDNSTIRERTPRTFG